MYYMVVHDDLDGVASAALYCRFKNIALHEVSLIFTSPSELPKVLNRLHKYVSKGDVIVIADLGCNTGTFNELMRIIPLLRNKNVVIEWYDHHIWEDNWINELRSLGIKLIIDNTTCATGIIARNFNAECNELMHAVCAADLWKWDHNLAPFLYRLAYIYHERGMLYKLFEKFYKGILIDDEAKTLIEEYISKEIKGYDEALRYTKVFKVNGCNVAVTVKDKGPPSRSHVAHFIIARKNVDVVAIYEIGHGLSFRSINIDVRRLATALGGGGHPRAAGVKIRIPLHIKLVSLLFKSILLRYVESIVKKVIEKEGCKCL